MPLRSAVKSERGFTLLELIIVLFVMVVGFGVVASNINNGGQNTRLQAAARDIASALRYAHGQALMTRRPVAVAVNLENNSYRIGNAGKIYWLDEGIEISLTVAEDQFREGQEGAILFFGDGSSTGGRIVLESGKLSRQIDVNWITGAVNLSVRSVWHAAA